jgi:peptidoglycan hydrolase FlgJ
MTDIGSVSRLATPPVESGSAPVASDREDAAREFERVLVKQFVQVMTKDLFKSTDEDAMSSVGAYGDIQRDALADVLTDHLVSSRTFKLQDLLLRQWAREASAETSDLPAGE